VLSYQYSFAQSLKFFRLAQVLWQLISASEPGLTLSSATTIVSAQVGTLTHSS
jgi:hypothetical protein